MILCSDSIRQAIKDGALAIEPEPTLEQYTTSAVDLRLGTDFRIWDHARLSDVPGVKTELNLATHDFHRTAQAHLKRMEIDQDGSILFPPYHVAKGHILGTTLERVHLRPGSRLAARVEGRSSLARLGLIVHLTAPTIHHGFHGTITLEMINFSAFHLRLVPEKTVICQLILEMLDRDPRSGEPNTGFQWQELASGDR